MSDAGEIIKSGAADKLADIVHKLAGPMAEELGLMMGDKIRVYRISNWTKTVAKTVKILREADLPPKAVAPRVFIPILEASSLEDDETLQCLWAGLLASASEGSDLLSASFVDTLRQLTPGQAKILEKMYEFAQAQDTTSGRDLSGWFPTDLQPVESQLASEAFARLGLIHREYNLESANTLAFSRWTRTDAFLANQTAPVSFEDWLKAPQDSEVLPILSSRWEFAEYGLMFMKACKGPRCTEGRSEGL
jgi:hypothetical protein